jgi:predicted nucleic acid-binding protein
VLYLDTSALLADYRAEAASARVQSLLGQQTEPVLVSHLTEVEVASAIARWVRMGELDDEQAGQIEAAWAEDLMLGRFLRKQIEIKHYQLAADWIALKATALRTLDALHLACASDSRAELVSEDAQLLSAAKSLGVLARVA